MNDSSLVGKRALIVEDNLLAGMSLESYLRDLGCEIVALCATSHDALACLANNPVDLALLDVNIIGGTSEPVARALDTMKLPYFFVSGYASPQLLPSDLRSRARLNKPVNPSRLRETMLECVASGPGRSQDKEQN